MSHPTTEELRRVEVFAGLDDAHLTWLAEHGEALDFAQGDTVFRPGDPADAMWVIVEGALELLIGVGGQMVPTFVQYAGEVTGLLPFSRLQHYSGVGRAASTLRLVRYPRSLFTEMLQQVPPLGQRLRGVEVDSVRREVLADHDEGAVHVGLPVIVQRREMDRVGIRESRFAPPLDWGAADFDGGESGKYRVGNLVPLPAANRQRRSGG